MAKNQKPLPNLAALQELHLALGFALQAAENYQKLLDKISRLEALEEDSNDIIFRQGTLIKGYETISDKRIQVCPECNGNGAYTIRGEIEECDKCDALGWIEVEK